MTEKLTRMLSLNANKQTKDVKKSKKLLKSNGADLSKGKKLFGKCFNKALAKASKIRKKSKEISRQLGSTRDRKKNRNQHKLLSKRSRSTNWPFPSESEQNRNRP